MTDQRNEHVPEPPRYATLSAEERALWNHLAPRLYRLGRLPEAYTPGLLLFISGAAIYLRLQHELAQVRAAGQMATVETTQLEQEISAWRTQVREMAADWELLPLERAGLALVDEQGVDVELKRILGLADERDAGKG